MNDLTLITLPFVIFMSPILTCINTNMLLCAYLLGNKLCVYLLCCKVTSGKLVDFTVILRSVIYN